MDRINNALKSFSNELEYVAYRMTPEERMKVFDGKTLLAEIISNYNPVEIVRRVSKFQGFNP